jgi:PAS domain S-box-containing protein
MSQSIASFFSDEGFMPHIHCYLNHPPLVWTMVVTDALIGISYLVISFTLISLVKRINLPFQLIFVAFGLFIFACGGTHFMEIYNLWVPNYWMSALVKVITAAASVTTAVAIIFLKDRIIAFANTGRSAERNLEALEKSDLRFKRSEMFLDSILENIPNMVFVKDAKDLRFVRLNRAGEALLGIRRQALLGKNDHDLFPKVQADGFVKVDRAVLGGKSVYDVPEEIIQTAAGLRFLHTRKIPVFGEDLNKPEYLLGISDDITEWKHAQEERLKVFGEKIALEERERAAVQNAFVADITTILASSFDYHETLKSVAESLVGSMCDYCVITLLNEDQTAERVTAAHRDPKLQSRMKGLLMEVPIGEDSGHPLMQVMHTGETLHRVEVTEFDLMELTRGNEKHLQILRELGCRSLILVPIKIRDKIHGAISIVSASADKLYNARDVVVAEEIASRAGAAIENAKLYEGIRQAVQSRDEFLSIASHELKTPLTALKLQLEFARRQVKPEQNIAPTPDKIARMLDTSGAQVNRLALLVDDLLDVSRIEAGKLNFSFESVDLAVVTRDVAERYHENITAAGSSLRLNLPDEPVLVWADPFRMEQVVLNVLSNAAKYGNHQPIELSVTHSKTHAQVICRDHGIGIPPAKIGKIFERFERAVESNHISGLGLGLYIAHEILSGHDGTIRAESKFGEGSTFIVELPLYQEQAR